MESREMIMIFGFKKCFCLNTSCMEKFWSNLWSLVIFSLLQTFSSFFYFVFSSCPRFVPCLLLYSFSLLFSSFTEFPLFFLIMSVLRLDCVLSSPSMHFACLHHFIWYLFLSLGSPIFWACLFLFPFSFYLKPVLLSHFPTSSPLSRSPFLQFSVSFFSSLKLAWMRKFAPSEAEQTEIKKSHSSELTKFISEDECSVWGCHLGSLGLVCHMIFKAQVVPHLHQFWGSVPAP